MMRRRAAQYRARFARMANSLSMTALRRRTLSLIHISNTDVLCSVILDTTSLRNGLSAQSGQNLSVFAKLFDRMYASAGTIWQATVDRSSVDYWMYDGDLALRYVPILPFNTEDFTSWIYRIPEGML